ncbi:MAG: patatin, partial [Flavipsychrobacter sp.]|nr:patatin [Flavipsychrobacter sp.]
IFLVSIGTGVNKFNKHYKEITAYQEFQWAAQIPDMLMQDASWQNQIILQWLSNSPVPWEIDGEIGNLSGDIMHPGTNGNGLISYLRYNAKLNKGDLEKLMSRTYTQEKVDSFIEMDIAANCEELFEIASVAAANEIHASHFPTSFNL